MEPPPEQAKDDPEGYNNNNILTWLKPKAQDTCQMSFPPKLSLNITVLRTLKIKDFYEAAYWMVSWPRVCSKTWEIKVTLMVIKT